MRALNQKHFEIYPSLSTDRLSLRAITLEDAQEILKMRSNAMVNRFIPRPEMVDLEQAEDLVQRTNQAFKNKQAIAFAGVLREQPRIIGTCGLTNIEHSNLRAEIGGEMATEFWGKGIAQEAFLAILQFGFKELGLHSIEAKVDPNNRGAVHLLHQAGFQKEAHFKDRGLHKGRFIDMAVYTLFE